VEPRKSLPILTEQQRAQLWPELLEVIENGKSGLSLNDIVGCPLDCGFCVRYLFDNCGMKVLRAWTNSLSNVWWDTGTSSRTSGRSKYCTQSPSGNSSTGSPGCGRAPA
jgi:hypothetical protein